MDNDREYGELIQRVTQLTETLGEVKISLATLVNRPEFDFRLNDFNSKLDNLDKRMGYKIDKHSRKIEGLQAELGKLWTRSTVGTEKLANTERLLWGILTVAGTAAGILIKSLLL